MDSWSEIPAHIAAVALERSGQPAGRMSGWTRTNGFGKDPKWLTMPAPTHWGELGALPPHRTALRLFIPSLPSTGLTCLHADNDRNGANRPESILATRQVHQSVSGCALAYNVRC